MQIRSSPTNNWREGIGICTTNDDYRESHAGTDDDDLVDLSQRFFVIQLISPSPGRTGLLLN